MRILLCTVISVTTRTNYSRPGGAGRLITNRELVVRGAQQLLSIQQRKHVQSSPGGMFYQLPTGKIRIQEPALRNLVLVVVVDTLVPAGFNC